MANLTHTNQQANDISRQEFLAFRLGGEEYGVDILKVQEIRSYDQVTRIANTPDFIKGVTNLRGIIVPIIDLRIKFELEKVAYDSNTVVIVLNLDERIVGIVVDSVSDVLSLSKAQISPAPDVATLSAKYLFGIGTIEERMFILVDIEKLLSHQEMNLVDQLSQD